MSMKQSKYEFNLLTDEAATEDYFADKTHEKIADTLCKIISDESSKVIIEKDFVHDVTLSYKQMFNEINVQLIDKGIIQKPSTMLDK